MIDVETSIEPPGLDSADGGEDRPAIHVSISLSEVDGTHRSGSMLLAGNATNAQIAHALVRCLLGCATMRGPALVAAVERWIRR